MSEIAANLAISMAQAGRRTLLVDTNFRGHTLPDLFIGSQHPSQGLIDYLTDRSRSSPFLAKNVLPKLSLMFAGETDSSAADLLVSDRFRDLVIDVRRTFDTTIAICPSSSRYGDARRIAALMGSAILIAQKDVTRIDRIKDLATKLQSDGVNVVGTFLDGRN